MDRSLRFDLEDPLQHAEKSGDEVPGWPGKRSLTQAMSSSVGDALPSELRAKLEGGLGTDLGGVRVHVDGAAARAAAGLQARAFTIGQAVYFGAGQYDPGSSAGKRLIAHEVAHTVQQRGAIGRPQLDAYNVSAPGDFHEVEAESFARSFAAGGATSAVMTPVSRGTIARAVIQRDLLDGAAPAPSSQPEALNPQPVDPSEIRQHAGDAIKRARSRGGTQAVVTTVGNLRAHASPTTRAPIENAISSELTADEKKQLDGGTANATPPNAAPAPPSAAPTPPTVSLPPNTPATPATKVASAPAAAQATNTGVIAPATTNTPAAGATPTPTPKDAKEEKGQAAAQPTVPAAVSEGSAPTPPSVAPVASAATTAPLENDKRDDVSARRMIEEELAFQDRWELYQNEGAGGRAAHLARTMFYGDGPGGVGSKLLHGDLAQGAIAVGIKVGAGVGVNLVASRTLLGKIPGVGNIIGGGLSAYALFSHGGAGAKQILGGIKTGIGGAFSIKNWKDSPWNTAANLVEGLCNVLDLIGHVCNILAGLAFAFAGIAAVGALLSVFFPPLAFLVPMIPVAITFGRACGGIATVCLATSSLISPIVTLFRTLNQIFSNQDPIKLAEQEDEYHSSMQDAIGTYGATRADLAIEEHGIKAIGMEGTGTKSRKVLGSEFVGDSVTEIGEGFEQYKSTMDGHWGPGATGQNFAAGARNAGQALGVNTKSPSAAGEHYFDPEGRAKVADKDIERERGKLDTEKDKLHGAKERQTELESKADTAQARLDNDPTSANFKKSTSATNAAERGEARVDKQEGKVSRQEHNVDRADWRKEMVEEGKEGGEIYDSGLAAYTAVSDDARQKKDKAMSMQQQTADSRGEADSKQPHRGQVILQHAPGTLAELDALDQQIAQAKAEQKQVAATTSQARQLHSQATVQSTGLKSAAAGVTQHVTANQVRSVAAQSQIATQNAELTNKTAQAHGSATQGTAQAASPLQGIANTARMIDGLLQRVPSNKFFDISSAKNNVHQFVLGMDQVAGAADKQQQAHGQANAAVAERGQHLAQAASKNQAATAGGQKLAADMHGDAAIAQTAGAQALEVAAQGDAAQQTAAQRAQQLEAERVQKWSALVAWAAKHREMRESVLKTGGGE